MESKVCCHCKEYHRPLLFKEDKQGVKTAKRVGCCKLRDGFQRRKGTCEKWESKK